MIRPLSAGPVSFRAIGAMDPVTQAQIQANGAYSTACLPDVYVGTPVEPHKKGGVVSFLVKTALAAGVVVGGAIAARRFIPALNKETLKVAETVPDGFVNQAKHYFAKYTDATEKFFTENYTKAKNWVVEFKDKHFNKTETPPEGTTPEVPKTDPKATVKPDQAGPVVPDSIEETA